MKRKRASKALSLLLTLCMVLGLLPGMTLTASAAEDTASTGCTHRHDESCGYVEAVAEVPCDKGCTDTDGDGVIDHAEDCAYTPAVEGQPCNHVHDENCGGLTAEEDPPAEEEAEEEEEPSVEEGPDEPEAVTALRARIDALPTGEAYRAMTADEQDAVYEEAAGISDEYFDLSEEERALVDITALEELFAVMNEDVALLTEGEVRYEPLEISAKSLNGNVIWGVTENWSSQITLDDYAAFYAQHSDRNSGKGGFPVDGSLTTDNGTPYRLATGGDKATAYDGNDCIRLYSRSKSVTMDLQTIGVYKNIYVLATAGGPGTGHYAKFNVTLNYTDGTKGETTYKLYDWYDLTAVDGVEKYYPVMRRENRSGAYDGKMDASFGPILQSATIEADTTRLLKSITFNLQGKDTGTDASGLYCGIFAVTGATPAGVPNAPVATAATKTEGDTSGAFTANWDGVEGAIRYQLDVATDRKFTSILNDYNNKDVGNVNSFKVENSIDANTTYYYRVRAVNSNGQSLSSNRISTDLPIWLKNALESSDYANVTYDAETNTVTFGGDVTLKGTITLPTDDTTVIDLGGSTVTAPAGKPAISAGTGSNVELTVTGDGASGRLVGNGTDSDGNGAPVIDFSGATGNSTIAVTGSTVTGASGSAATGDSTSGGSGGAGIAASNSTQVEVGSGATVTGGNGGDATGEKGNGGSGGAGISGGNVSVSSGGTVTGGNGGDATGKNGKGGNGGAGISGGNPSSSGTVTGGNGGNGASIGGQGGSPGTSNGNPGNPGSTHIHSWVYTANGNKIMAYCEAQGGSGCKYQGEGNAVALTLTANNAAYSGSAYSGASVANGITPVTKAAAGSIFYKGTGATTYDSSATPPTVCGTYQASVAVRGQTATADFTITQKTINPSVTMVNYEYGTTPSTPVINADQGDGAVTYYYSTYSDIVTNQAHRLEWKDITGTTLNVGTYYMAAHVAATGNYAEGTSAVITFKVTPSSYAAPTAPTVSNFTVTINEADREKKLEYSLDGTNWVTVPTLNSSGSFELTGLAGNTSYTVYLRQKASADGNYAASASISTSFTTPARYSVAYNANYGSGTVPASVTQNSGSSVTVDSGSGLRRTGYTFSGWNTKADGSGTDYAAGVTINTGATLYAKWTPNTYTVKFNANGGTGTMEDQSLTYDAAATPLSAKGFTKDGFHFAGWATSAGGSAVYSDKQSVKNLASGGNVTLYAVWVQNVYGISGTITGVSNADVTVKLMRGTTEVASSTVKMTGSTPYTGTYGFSNIPAGTYNIVATQDVSGKTRTVTALVVVTNSNQTDENITMPRGDTNSVLVVKEDTRPVVVGGLDAEAKTKAVESKTVTVTMTVEKQEEQQLPNTASPAEQQTQAAIAEIKAKAPGKTLEFMDIEVQKEVKSGVSVESTEKLTQTNAVMEIIIPYDMTGKSNITVYRNHNGSAAAFTQLSTRPGSGAADGTYYLDTANHLIYVYAQKFSTYAIGYTVPSPGGSGGSPGGSGGSSGGSGSGSGGSGSGSTSYPVTISDSTPDGGKISVIPKSATKGSTVTITVTPDDGYELDKLSVKDKNGKEIAITAKGNGKYTFTMPAGTVTVEATFKSAEWNIGYVGCPKDNTCPIWPYTDAKTTDWYHDGVHFCLENGLMMGYGDNIFQPNAPTTRSMLIVMLWRLNGSPVVNYALDFADVKEGAWYTEAVRWAKSEGVAGGYGNGKFGPNDTLTREQMVAMLYRYAQYKGYDVSVGEDTNILSYGDATTVAEYAIPAMQWACGSGVVGGTAAADGSGLILDPKGSTTRVQMATMVMRFCAEIVK